MINLTELTRSFLEAHEEEIRQAIWAQLEEAFDAEEIANLILNGRDIPEMLAELVTLPF